MKIEAASHSILANVRAILDRTGLPTAGLEDQFPGGYIVAVESDEIVGCAGLEVYGRHGLLRSLAVDSKYQRAGIGRVLVANRVAAARSLELVSVYLLTTTVPDYFLRLGFHSADRADVPPKLGSCPEFAGICPASATCLTLDV